MIVSTTAACPRCHGFMRRDSFPEGDELTCLICGRVVYLQKQDELLDLLDVPRKPQNGGGVRHAGERL